MEVAEPAAREYGAAIFSPGLAQVLLIKRGHEGSWAFPFTSTTESDVHVVAATSAVRQLLGIDIGDKISRAHWVEAEFPATGALVRLYVALGLRPESAVPHCTSADDSARWHPLTAILPPVNAVLRPERERERHEAPATGAAAGAVGAGGGSGSCGGAGVSAAAEAEAEAGEEEAGGDLLLEPGIAPFLAKLKTLLHKHPEWRISQLDPHLTSLIQLALAPPPPGPPAQPQPTDTRSTGAPQQQQQHPQQQQQEQEQQEQGHAPDSPAAAPAEGGGPAAAGGGGGASGGGGGEAAGAATVAVAVKEEPPDEAAAAPPGPLGPVPSEQTAEQRQPEQAVPEAAPEAAGEAVRGGAGGEGGGVGPAATAAGAAAAAAEGSAASWRGPRPQEYLSEYCRHHGLPEPCYSLVVKKSARRPLVSASCLLPHLGVTVTPDMHVPGGMGAACQAAALAALLWLEGALPADGGEWVRVVPVGWPPLLSEARGESWEAAQAARRGGARRELEAAQKEALLREMDKKRQRLVAEAAELERLMAQLRGGGWEAVSEPDLARLTASLGLGPGPGSGPGAGAATGQGGDAGAEPSSCGLAGLAGSVTMGLQALQFRSGSGSGSGAAATGSGFGGRGGTGASGGRAPGTKRPRDDGAAASWLGPGAPGGQQGREASPAKNVVMELKELCDRRRWPQPQYAYTALPGGGGQGQGAAAAVVTLPAAAGLKEVNSGPQVNRKRAKEAAAAAALAQLSALGLK